MRPPLVPIALAAALAAAPAHGLELIGPGGGHYSIGVGSLKQQQRRGVVFQQKDFSCGSAALAILLTHHYQRPVSEEQVFEAMFRRGDQPKIQREGFSLLDMKNYLETLGYKADGFEQPLSRLEESGLPAIALIRDNGYHHFVVIKGVRQGRVLLGDPAMGLRAMKTGEFEAIWPSKVLFVIHSHQRLARANLPAEWAAKPAAPVGDSALRATIDGSLMRRQPGDLY
jgi:predicted double-glycine peptidase